MKKQQMGVCILKVIILVHMNLLIDIMIMLPAVKYVVVIIIFISLSNKNNSLDAEIEALIEERNEARKAKNFQRADEIRNELLEKGIELKDTREGTIYERSNNG